MAVLREEIRRDNTAAFYQRPPDDTARMPARHYVA